MRVLHLITTETTADTAFAIPNAHHGNGQHACGQNGDIEAVIMAPDNAKVIDWAMDVGMAALRLRPGQSSSRVHDAMMVLEPDVVHLHGVLAADAALPLSMFAHLPMVLHLHQQDLTPTGHLRRQLRGVRLDRGPHVPAWVVCTRAGLAEPSLARSGLPIGVSNVLLPELSRSSPEWFLGVYRRLLSVPGRAAASFSVSPAS